jgi:hypothetical protein
MMGGIRLKSSCFRVLRLFVFSLALLFMPSFAAAAGYSADVVTTGKSGTTHAKMWVSYSLWAQRMEPQAQPNMIIIVRMDRKLIWNIDTREKRYMEFTMRPGMGVEAIVGGEKSPAEIERTYLLTEMVEGFMADKYQITYQFGNDKTTHFVWLLKDNNMFPIKTQYKDSVTIFKNLVLEEPAASMFEVPAGYNKFSIPFMN